MHEDGFDLEFVDKAVSENGWQTTTKYKCPCGNGVLLLHVDHYDRTDDYYGFDCKNCGDEYEILWGKGVIPGNSPMVRKVKNK